MDIFTALADPTRREIVQLLAANEQLSSSAIYQKFDKTHPAISQHLKVLHSAQLVSVEKKAQKRLYRINSEKITELEEWLKKMKTQWEERFERLDKMLTEGGETHGRG